MIEELSAAGSLLKSALERYYDACSKVELYCRTNDLTTATSDRISSELLLLETFAKILNKAKLSINYSRNSSRYIVPINILPPEILIHIISLAVALGHKACKKHKIPYCYNPVHLQHISMASVCTRWRNLVLQCPAFWSRIDLVHVHDSRRELIPRAKFWAERIGSFPLDVRVAVDSHGLLNDGVLQDFPSSISGRHNLGSISFILQGVGRVNEGNLFTKYLSGWAPGTLQKLVIERTRSSPHYLLVKSIHNTQQQDSSSCLLIDLSHEYLEALWKPIVTLRLHGLYIDWGSQAYHGLVELCLLSDRNGSEMITISESQLQKVLMSSPGLRIFRFGIEITADVGRMLQAGDSVSPVQLNDLQILDLDFGALARSPLQHLLRWVGPGSKPLMLLLPRSYVVRPETDLFSRNKSEIHDFLIRAKVTKLYLYTRTPTLDWLFVSTPYLRTLAVGFKFPWGSAIESQVEFFSSIPHGGLDELYILASELEIDRFYQWLAGFPPIRTLVFWRCEFLSGGRNRSSADSLHLRPLNINSEVLIIPDESPDPTSAWQASPYGYNY
ncbi:unnamed protein product [Rhizoctonia solani]|uniref:F-box domain-containing protein n=1 Tax=Rhizoctonia solani TaxID=456999 RepID=A0A8H3BNT9_9AGAM|nr:unnamed protein product [Rhizoctonia solani]